MTLSLVEGFHTPGLATNRTVEHLDILRDTPVGTDYTLESRLIAQLLLDEPVTITATHVLA